MNLKEAYVVQDLNLSVTVKPTISTEWAKGEYKINEITRCFDKIIKKYYYNATVTSDGRALYHFNIDVLNPAAGYENLIADKLEQREKLKAKNYIKKLFDELGTKKKVSDYIGKLIDELKSDKKSNKKQSKFVKPTIEEIQQYIDEKNYSFDAEEFYNHYESNGWMVGKTHMKQWKSACANWNKRQQEFSPKKSDTKKERLKSKPNFDIDDIAQKAMFSDEYDV